MNKLRRYPFVSGMLGFIIPGLGQLYNGKPAHFFVFIALMFFCDAAESAFDMTHTFKGALAYVICMLAIQVLSAITSVVTSIRNGLIEPKVYQRWYVYFLIVVSFLSVSFVHSPFDTLHSYYIPTGSMSPAIEIGDRVIAVNDNRNVHRGDVVVFNPPKIEDGKDFLKRCIAVPGDSLLIHGDSVYINGKKLDERYAVGATNFNGFSNAKIIEGTVPADSYVMLGDNREHSLDSRYFGYVPRDRIKGKVLYIWYARDRKRIGIKF